MSVTGGLEPLSLATVSKAVGSTTYALRVVEGKMRGHIYELPENSELVVGRGANFDIVIEEDMVSRRHAKITTFHHEIVVQDLHSTNGTIVNQQRVEGGHRLQVGDLLNIGTCVLELISPAEVAAAHQQIAAQPAPPSPGLAIGGAFPSPQSPAQSMATSTIGMSPLPGAQQGYAQPNQPPAQHAAPLSAPATSPLPPPMQPPAQQGGFHQPTQQAGFQQAPPQPSFQPPPSQMPAQASPQASFQQPAAPAGGNFYGGSAGGFNSLAGMRPRTKSESGNFPSHEVPDMISMVERLVERRHDGILVVMDHDEREGSIYLRAGRVYFASVEDPHHFSEHPLHPLQSLIRICGWAQGSFKVKSSSALPTFEGELNEESRNLMDRVRQSCAELKSLRAQLPPLDARLAIPSPLNPPLAHLNADQLNAFQLCMNHSPIQQVIDFHPQGEREGIRVLLSLLEAGYLVRV